MSDDKFFGPLTLHQDVEHSKFSLENIQKISCVLCDYTFTLPAEKESLLLHLFTKHKLVISDINDIADLIEYLRYWRLRFKDEDLPFFCTTMLLEGKPDGTEPTEASKEHFLLSDVLPEDKELRSNLQQVRLEKMLKHHEFEREDRNYEKECLFCRHNSKDTRSCYLKHLYEKHNFHIAKPENLIFIDELVNLIASKLEKLICIYCEKLFKDRVILKEHMRKKGHKRINPDNKEYDKYFLVNYLGEKELKDNKIKSARKVNNLYRNKSTYCDADKKDNSNVDSDPEWSEWVEDNGPLITCLLCDHAEKEYDHILRHMEKIHDFSFEAKSKGLNFYHKVKMVNFMRRFIHLKQCFSCETKFDEGKNLLKHMKEAKHINLSKAKWDQPEYYFPTYEDDLFLCFIQDDDESWWSSDDAAEGAGAISGISKEMAMSVINDK